MEPIPNDDLPKALEEINWSAVAANTYNGALVLPVVFLVQVAHFASFPLAVFGGSALGFPAFERLRETHGGGEVFNPPYTALEVDYYDLLYSPTTLAAGESGLGLVFFKLKSREVDWSDLRMEVSLR